MTLHQLRVFRAVARHRNFTRAAGELLLTQSAVSAQIRELTAILGTPLLEVLGKRVHLTDAGRLLEKHAVRLEGVIGDLIQEFIAITETDAGAVRIGASSSIGTYYLPQLFADFAARHPRVTLSLAVENTALIEERLLRNEFDLGFIGSPAGSGDLVSDPFLEDEIFFACSPGHPLAKQSAVSPERLSTERIVVREPGSATRATMEALLARQGLALPSFMELGSVEAIKRVVMAGLGISYFSALTVCSEIAAGWLSRIRVRGLTASRSFFIARHHGKRETPALGAFIGFARAWQFPAE